MSLVAFAARMCAVKALRGATYAGVKVFDSSVDQIDMIIENESNPLIVVYTDDDETEVDGKDVLGGTRRLDVVIEMAVASKVSVGTDAEDIVIPHTDAGMEATMAFMGRQALRALTAGQTEWSKLWRKAVTRVHRMAMRRGAGADKGVRYAARQLVLTVDTIAEPYFGAIIQPGDFWADLLAAMEADTDAKAIATILRGEIEEPELSVYEQPAAALGVDLSSIDHIGVGEGAIIPGGDIADPNDAAGPVTGGRLGIDGRLDEADTISDALPPE